MLGQYAFNPSQYFMLQVPACWWYGHDALNQSWVNVGRPSVTLAHIQSGAKHNTVMVTQYWANGGFSAGLVKFLEWSATNIKSLVAPNAYR